MTSLNSCGGAGNSDGKFEIVDGYYHFDPGGNGALISHDESGIRSRIVVGPRVDSFVIDGKKIIVARRPAEVITVNGISEWRLYNVCEYWLVDTGMKNVAKIANASQWPDVKCDMGKTYGALTSGGNPPEN